MGAPAPAEYLKWIIVKDTGWTLDTINKMNVNQIHEFFSIRDARLKARK